MAARNGYRPQRPRELADEEHRIDNARGHRHCPQHRDQTMIPLLPGVDLCPACTPVADGQHPTPGSPALED